MAQAPTGKNILRLIRQGGSARVFGCGQIFLLPEENESKIDIRSDLTIL